MTEPTSRDISQSELRRTSVPREEVVAAFATAPVLDAEAFRASTDNAFGQTLSDRKC